MLLIYHSKCWFGSCRHFLELHLNHWMYGVNLFKHFVYIQARRSLRFISVVKVNRPLGICLYSVLVSSKQLGLNRERNWQVIKCTSPYHCSLVMVCQGPTITTVQIWTWRWLGRISKNVCNGDKETDLKVWLPLLLPTFLMLSCWLS